MKYTTQQFNQLIAFDFDFNNVMCAQSFERKPEPTRSMWHTMTVFYDFDGNVILATIEHGCSVTNIQNMLNVAPFPFLGTMEMKPTDFNQLKKYYDGNDSILTYFYSKCDTEFFAPNYTEIRHTLDYL
jgi:hypothetical protein